MMMVRLFIGALAFALSLPVAAVNAGEIGVCAIIEKPANFDHQSVTLQGTATQLKETTSRRGNDYTTFKLQGSGGCGAVSIFTWGHPTLNDCDQVRVDGVFEVERHQGKYTFYNEVDATKVTCVPH